VTGGNPEIRSRISVIRVTVSIVIQTHQVCILSKMGIGSNTSIPPSYIPFKQGEAPFRVDLRQLGQFVRIAELGSITKVAGLLCVPQPALSRQLRAPEVELNANFFKRNGRGVLLTDAGRRFRDHARGVLRGVDCALLSVPADNSGEGRAVVGLPPSVGKVLTLPLVERFVEEFPKADVDQGRRPIQRAHGFTDPKALKAILLHVLISKCHRRLSTSVASHCDKAARPATKSSVA